MKDLNEYLVEQFEQLNQWDVLDAYGDE